MKLIKYTTIIIQLCSFIFLLFTNELEKPVEKVGNIAYFFEFWHKTCTQPTTKSTGWCTLREKSFKNTFLLQSHCEIIKHQKSYVLKERSNIWILLRIVFITFVPMPIRYHATLFVSNSTNFYPYLFSPLHFLDKMKIVTVFFFFVHIDKG